MTSLTRRTTLGLVGSVAWASAAVGQSPRTRPDVRSAAGQAQLATYAQAVRRMMALPASDPKSWTFLWYVHAVHTDSTKAREIVRLYPMASPTRTLAEETWSTCQAHARGTNPDYFLPWHRMYLLYFEEAVRSVLGDPGFVLPYWNYVDPTQRSLPAAFLRQNDPTWGALWRPNRVAAVNAGAAIDAGLTPSPVNSQALSQTTYRPSGARAGFCQELDGKLHGTIHVRVGNVRGMGSVPWAANDPIFWLHHCNIDRLWASWNRNGGQNPSDGWVDQAFIFPDGRGGRAVARIGSVLNMTDVPYVYETYEAGPTIAASAAARPARPVVPVARASAVAVGPGGAEVSLSPTPGRRPPVIGAGARRYFLVLSDLKATAQPGVLYQVELKDRASAWRSVGFINFFDAYGAAHDHGDAAATGAPPAKRFSFDVTDIASGMGGQLAVRIRPSGQPESEAVPVVGLLELVEN